MYLTSCYDSADISWTPCTGSRWTYLRPLGHFKARMYIKRQEMREVAWNQNTMRPRISMPVNTVKSLCCLKLPPLLLFYSFHMNSSVTLPVPLRQVLRFPVTHDGSSEMEVKGPCGAFTNGKRIGLFSIVGSVSKVSSCYVFRSRAPLGCGKAQPE